MKSLVDTIQSVPRLRPECVMCVIRKYANKYPEGASNWEKVDYMQKVFSIMGNASKTTAIPVLTRDIDQLRYDMFGDKEEYGEIKYHYNEIMMQEMERFRQDIRKAEDPLLYAMQLALAGNYIDFSAVANVNEEDLDKMLDAARDLDIDKNTFERFRGDLEKGGSLVFFTDNCGEVVLDMLLMEEIMRQHPDIRISAVVKGQEAVNDATMEDAVQIGLDKMVLVAGNGSNIGGSWVPEMPEEVVDMIEEADIIFSKGQANFETFRHCGRNAYYLFLCKCNVFADQFQTDPFTGIFVHEADPRNDNPL